MSKWWIPWTLGAALFGLMGIAPGIADSTSPGPFSVHKSVRITDTTTRTPTSVQSTRTNTTTTTITNQMEKRRPAHLLDRTPSHCRVTRAELIGRDRACNPITAGLHRPSRHQSADARQQHPSCLGVDTRRRLGDHAESFGGSLVAGHVGGPAWVLRRCAW